MATQKTDVVIIGVGAVGGILAAELGKAGMKVIGLERGPRLTTQDFSSLDELRYFQRQDLRPNFKRQPVTWRRDTRSEAKPLLPCALAYGRALRRIRNSRGLIARRLAANICRPGTFL